MKVIDNEMVSTFDVDETLTLEPKITHENYKSFIGIFDPALNETVARVPHKKHIELLKRMHGRGRYIVVWSGNGVKWAESVIKTLGLEKYVDVVMSKPICYVDDYPSSQWLNNQIYIKQE